MDNYVNQKKVGGIYYGNKKKDLEKLARFKMILNIETDRLKSLLDGNGDGDEIENTKIAILDLKNEIMQLEMRLEGFI